MIMNTKGPEMWDVMPCSFTEKYWHFGKTYPKDEAAGFRKMLVRTSLHDVTP